jgi:hypothetical protein
MSSFASCYERASGRRGECARRQLGTGGTAARYADEACALPEHSATESERLERIAMYARAGYFNLGYGLEMFHLAGEMPPE